MPQETFLCGLCKYLKFDLAKLLCYNKKIVLGSCAFLFGFFDSNAQQDPLFTYYMFNPIHFNPAYSGVEGYASITSIHRSQWVTSAYGIETQYMGMNTPVFGLRGGLGFYLINDNIRNRHNLSANVTYAYHVDLGNNRLSFGLKSGIYNATFSTTKNRVLHLDDPYLKNDRSVYTILDLGVGIFWKSKNYYLGLSTDHIANTSISYASDISENFLEPQFYLFGGYDYDVSHNLLLRPSILFRSDLSSFSFDVNTIGIYNESVWGGISYRWEESIVLMLGYNLTKERNLSIGMSFDYAISNFEAKANLGRSLATSLEFVVSYLLPIDFSSTQKIIHTPRFRY